MPLLTSVGQVLALSPAEAARKYPVHLRGVLTFHDWGLNYFWDGTGGIYIRHFKPDGTEDRKLQSGREIEVDGVTILPAFWQHHVAIAGPDLGSVSIRNLGPGQWPQTSPLEAVKLEESDCDSQWVAVSGTVKSVVRANDGMMLNLATAGSGANAAVPRWSSDHVLPGYMRGLRVLVRGVVTRKSMLPESEGSQVPTLLVPAFELVEIDPKALETLFDQAAATVEYLDKVSHWERPRLKMSGQVLFIYPGRGFFIRMGDGYNLWVQTVYPGKIKLGDWVDVVGWLDHLDGQVLLTDALFRAGKPGVLPPFLDRKAGEINTHPTAFQGKMIALEGDLIEQQAHRGETALLLKERGLFFNVRLFSESNQPLSSYEPGSRLAVKGVCVSRRMPFNDNPSASFSFQIWLNSPADVTLLQPPGWWTLNRVLGLCGFISLLTLMALVWGLLLRRQVVRQTALIGSQIEREAVAQERTRIARELHDTLGQELIGTGLLLDFVAQRMTKSPEEVERALTAAQKMISRSQAETKRSVADLRAGELEGDLAAAVEERVRPLVEASGTSRFELAVEGLPRRLPGVMEHHLLRIVQESVANALRHAHAERIVVRISYGPGTVALAIQDNGCGFKVAKDLTVASGHFGLLGLEERVNKLQGHWSLDSEPGKGTRISVTVPLKEDSAS